MSEQDVHGDKEFDQNAESEGEDQSLGSSQESSTGVEKNEIANDQKAAKGNGSSGKTNLFAQYQQSYKRRETEQMSLEDYLELCSKDRMAYATAAERLLNAIGEPEVYDTSKDERLGRIFQNRTIRYYPGFKGMYGMENAVENIVSHLRHAAQGLEESKQILYLLGPVGGGKSTIAEKMKKLMEKNPIYVLAYHKADDDGNLLYDDNGNAELEYSPLDESPLGMFDPAEWGDTLRNEYGIPERYQEVVPSPWAAKRLGEVDGDISRFRVVKRWPSVLDQIAVAKTEPGDENNQDVSNLTGSVDIRKVEEYAQNDPDAFDYAGGLNKATQGILEFVEMFKAPLKSLNPLLTSTQEGHYAPPENPGAFPFEGVIMAHSNESEWQAFKADKKNEAFLDRVNPIKIPYCLRVDEEVEIYKKLLNHSDIGNAPCAPGTLEMMAQFSVLSRLENPTEERDLGSLVAKMRVYNGQQEREKDKNAKSMNDYRSMASEDEGMSGFSTRFAYKTLSRTFNHEAEVAADPVDLMYYLQRAIAAEQFPEEQAQRYKEFINDFLAPQYYKRLKNEIQSAYVESYATYGQNMFDHYIERAKAWLDGQDHIDPDTHDVLDSGKLDQELKKVEQHAGIGNPSDFRNEIVRYSLSHQRDNDGANPDWRSYEPIRRVIEAHMFERLDEILPTVTPGKKQNNEQEQKRAEFVDRMKEKGYTERQVDKLIKWAERYKNNDFG